MTPESVDALEAGVDLLRDQIVRDLDRSTWPYAEVPESELSNMQRRARVWHTKGAEATLALLARYETMLEKALDGPTGPSPVAPGQASAEDAAAEEAEIAAAEADAERLIARLDARHGGHAGGLVDPPQPVPPR